MIIKRSEGCSACLVRFISCALCLVYVDIIMMAGLPLKEHKPYGTILQYFHFIRIHVPTFVITNNVQWSCSDDSISCAIDLSCVSTRLWAICYWCEGSELAPKLDIYQRCQTRVPPDRPFIQQKREYLSTFVHIVRNPSPWLACIFIILDVNNISMFIC